MSEITGNSRCVLHTADGHNANSKAGSGVLPDGSNVCNTYLQNLSYVQNFCHLRFTEPPLLPLSVSRQLALYRLPSPIGANPNITPCDSSEMIKGGDRMD